MKYQKVTLTVARLNERPYQNLLKKSNILLVLYSSICNSPSFFKYKLFTQSSGQAKFVLTSF